jgi:hypothetical protein
MDDNQFINMEEGFKNACRLFKQQCEEFEVDPKDRMNDVVYIVCEE